MIKINWHDRSFELPIGEYIYPDIDMNTLQATIQASLGLPTSPIGIKTRLYKEENDYIDIICSLHVLLYDINYFITNSFLKELEWNPLFLLSPNIDKEERLSPEMNRFEPEENNLMNINLNDIKSPTEGFGRPLSATPGDRRNEKKFTFQNLRISEGHGRPLSARPGDHNKNKKFIFNENNKK